MYQLWLNYGEFAALGVWGILLATLRRILFGRLCRDAVIEGNGGSPMRRAMALRYEKSAELGVEIRDASVFVRKYLCLEQRLRVRLPRWRTLPERWAGLVLGTGILEAVALHYLGYGTVFCVDRFLAAVAAFALVRMACLWLESESLWEQAAVCFVDYAANTLAPRKQHVRDVFEEKDVEEEQAVQEAPEEKQRFTPTKEEEQLFQEVLTELLSSST
ncbi:MAG: hypothetical protein LUC60_03575 [Lachnospiraceae bacterium]|nr:hypothetical protein [Lachnospiraceae bacterium]